MFIEHHTCLSVPLNDFSHLNSPNLMKFVGFFFTMHNEKIFSVQFAVRIGLKSGSQNHSVNLLLTG